MSKRCCAKNCFNSVLYNKNIAYFSFPKNKEFAEQWAVLAGRDDLKEKPLSRIIKYYLCSEHFTANCFVDTNAKQILKRNLPYSIALPTIFRNNLQETIQNANPRHSIEIHNIVLLDDNESIKSGCFTEKGTANKPCVPQYSSPQSDLSCLEKDEFFTYDDFENISPALEVCLQSTNDEKQENTLVPVLQNNEVVSRCRLCFRELISGEPFTQIENSLNLKEFISRVMDNLVYLICVKTTRQITQWVVRQRPWFTLQNTNEWKVRAMGLKSLPAWMSDGPALSMTPEYLKIRIFTIHFLIILRVSSLVMRVMQLLLL